VLAHEGHGVTASGEPNVLGDLGHDPDFHELAVVARDQYDPLALGHVDGQGYAHIRKDDSVVKGNQPYKAHGYLFSREGYES
jgi:hypothetical protein